MRCLRQFAVVACVGALAVEIPRDGVAADEDPGVEHFVPDLNATSTVAMLPSVARDTNRRVWVASTNNADKLVMLRWADDRIGRMERLTNIPRGSVGPTLRISLLPAQPGVPEVSTEQQLESGEVVQRLVLRGNGGLPERAAVDEALCRLLIYGYVLDHWDSVSAGRDVGRWVQRDVPAAVPTWIWRGLAGCLEPSTRAASSDRVVAAWHTGQLVPLVGFLRAGGRIVPLGLNAADAAGEDLLRAYETMAMLWLLGQPEPASRLDTLFAALAAGESITPNFLAATMPDVDTVVDLEEQWDAWILAQGRIIYRPGQTRPADIIRLGDELALTRGLDGIPSGAEFPASGTMRDLLAHRDAPWIPTFASAKTLRLRTLALGRDAMFQNVVERYCAYLKALGERRNVKRLESLLGGAEGGMVTEGNAGGQAAAPRGESDAR